MMPLRDAARRAEAFDRYAAWYDAFNQGKDYDAETAYVLRRIQGFAGTPNRWLDVGCGTGRHLGCLDSKGIDVEGLDSSPAMIAHARLAHPRIPFHVGSAHDFRLDGDRDVVSLLFHVIDYQVSDGMVRDTLSAIANHLAPAGLLVFDFWNSDAIERDPPVRRVKEARIDGRPLVRISVPSEGRRRRRVDVRYEFRWDSDQGPLEHEELHAVRHFSAAELEVFLQDAGMTVLTCEAWMRNRRLSQNDWYGFICAGLEERRARRSPPV